MFSDADSLIKQAADGDLVVLDLSSGNVSPAEIVARLHNMSNPPAGIVAVGPHVHEARLAAARDAGCDEVLTRGQFNAQMDAILQRWL
jgi:CheY-like chemotaxis protein